MWGDIARAVGQLDDPKFLRVVGKAVLLTLSILACVTGATVGLVGWLLPETLTIPWVGTFDLAISWLSWAALGLMLILSVVLMVPVASVFVSVFADEVADAVEARHYPGLPVVDRLPLGEVAIDALRFLGLVILVNLVALVIYLASNVLAPFVFWIVNGFLLGREYAQLVAARRIGTQAARRFRKRHFWEVWMLGAALAVPLSVPVVNLFVPVLGVAAFTHHFHRQHRD